MITRFGQIAKAAEAARFEEDHKDMDDVMDACADSITSLRIRNYNSPTKKKVGQDEFFIPANNFYGSSTATRPSVLRTMKPALKSPSACASMHAMSTRNSPKKDPNPYARRAITDLDFDLEDEDDDDFESDSLCSSGSSEHDTEFSDHTLCTPVKENLLTELRNLTADSGLFLSEDRSLHDDASDYNPSEDEGSCVPYDSRNNKVGSSKWRPKLNWRANLLASSCYQASGTEKYECVAQLFKFRTRERRWVNKGPVLLILLSNEFRVVAHYLYGTHDVALNIPMWEFWSLHFRPSPFCPERTILLNSYGNEARTKVEFVPHTVKLAQTLSSPLTRPLSDEILNSDVVYLENKVYTEREEGSTLFALRFDADTTRDHLLATINEMVIRLRSHDREKRSATYLQPAPIIVDSELPDFFALQKEFGGKLAEFPCIQSRGFIEALAACGFVYSPRVKLDVEDYSTNSARCNARVAADNVKCVYCGAELENFDPQMGTHCGTRQGTQYSVNCFSDPRNASNTWINPKYIQIDPREFHMFLPQIQHTHKQKALSMGLLCPYAEAIEHYLSGGTTIQDPSLPQSLKEPANL